MAPDSVGQALLAVADDPEHRREIQHKARRLAETFQWPRVAARFERLLAELSRTRMERNDPPRGENPPGRLETGSIRPAA